MAAEIGAVFSGVYRKFCDWGIDSEKQNPGAERRDAADGGLPRRACILLRSRHGEDGSAKDNRPCTADDLCPISCPRAAQLAKEQASPKQAHQAVRIPKRKCNRKAHITHGVNGESVRHGPQHPPNQSLCDQVGLFEEIPEHESRSLEWGRNRPACNKCCHHHSHRNQEWRESFIDDLGRRFGATQPNRSGQPAEHPQFVQGNGRSCRPSCAVTSLIRLPQRHQQRDSEDQHDDRDPQMHVREDCS